MGVMGSQTPFIWEKPVFTMISLQISGIKFIESRQTWILQLVTRYLQIGN